MKLKFKKFVDVGDVYWAALSSTGNYYRISELDAAYILNVVRGTGGMECIDIFMRRELGGRDKPNAYADAVAAANRDAEAS